uniref:Uncharacterized protein n=1 Tax=Siphoviridae sp. ct96x5 TaxID=2825367 RepID=A0A8S5PRN3_9CAUD|nr:MAG TPA: hypothetical protein [Siphoviridae sp. ct96x5]
MTHQLELCQNDLLLEQPVASFSCRTVQSDPQPNSDYRNNSQKGVQDDLYHL